METRSESTHQPETPNRSTWKFSLPYASVTSTFALLISCLTFYFSNLREVHSLQLSVVRTKFQPKYSRKLSYVLTDLIVLNRGNRTEAIISMNFSYPVVGRPDVRIVSSERGPYVLKAGDAIPVTLSDTITVSTFERSGNWKGKFGQRKAKIEFDIIVQSVSPDTGSEIERKIMRHKLLYDELSNKISFEYYDNPSETSLYDLL